MAIQAEVVSDIRMGTRGTRTSNYILGDDIVPALVRVNRIQVADVNVSVVSMVLSRGQKRVLDDNSTSGTILVEDDIKRNLSILNRLFGFGLEVGYIRTTGGIMSVDDSAHVRVRRGIRI